MTNEITPAPRRTPVSFAPTNLVEAMEFSKLIAPSALVPDAYRNKPADILLAIQMGAELGISPIQALQGIAIIRNKATVWGDTALALVEASGLLEDKEEKIIPGDGDKRMGYCRLKRKGRPTPTIQTFSIADAKEAKLWGKSGPWTDYPDRMLRMRARGFALRDTFSDVLRGIWTREEAMDIPGEDEPRVKAESDIPWVERISGSTYDPPPGDPLPKGEDDLTSALEASIEAAKASPPPDVKPVATAPVVASNSSLGTSVVEVGGGPELPWGDLDEPVLINEHDRRRFHACREEGNHSIDETKSWLHRVYGITSTKQIQRDWMQVICKRLVDTEKL